MDNIITRDSPSSEGSSSEESLSAAMNLAASRPKKRAGRRVFKETRHPVYRGVRRRNNNKWVCEVRVPNDKSTRIWLGTYSTPEMAARAHDVAALALRGKSACLNFADSAWRLPLPATTNADDIRKVASMAAQAFAADNNNNNNNNMMMNTEEFEVCSSSSSISVTNNTTTTTNNVANDNDNDDPMMMSEEFNILNMADEPLRSPPHHSYWGWTADVDTVDAEVSLWQF